MSAKRPTLKMIAVKCGVTITTVSDALRGDPRVAETTRKRVKQVAKEMGYMPNPFAQMLVANRSSKKSNGGNLACLFGHPDADYYDTLLNYQEAYAGIVERCQEIGFAMDRFWVYEASMTATRLRGILESRGVVGIILFALRPEEIDLPWAHYALSTIAFRDYEQAKARIHFSFSDMYVATDIALKHLMDSGHERIGFATYFNQSKKVLGKVIGAIDFIAASKKIENFYWYENVSQDVQTKSQAAFIQWFKKNKPDVLLTWNSVEAEIIAEWMSSKEITKSEQVDCFVISLAGNVPMQGVRQPYKKMGSTSVDLLINQLYRNERGFPEEPLGAYVRPYLQGD